jgi:hypothetical protein
MAEQSTVLIDANLLTLWIVGQVSEDVVPQFRRTRKYSIEDYQMLARYLAPFLHVMIIPNIATETSNLLGGLYGDYLRRARAILAAGLSVWNEFYVQSALASNEPDFNRLGLTDAAILISATRETEVLTDDLDLYLSLSRQGIPVTNFTHLRTAGLLES